MINSSRRDFLSMLGVAGGVFAAPRGLFAALEGERKLRLGVCSDVHIDRATPELWKWKKALEYFRDQKVDVVVVSGDLANRGRIVELEDFAKAWWDTFPNGKRPDGESVEHVFVTGNHDMAVDTDTVRKKYAERDEKGNFKKNKKGEIIYDLEAAKKDTILFNKERIWPELFHEPYKPFFAKQIKGYWFIGNNWRLSFEKFDYEAVELPQFMKDHADEIGKTKPFFFVQHCHPRGTCHGQDAWWPDCGKYTTEVFKEFPNAVCFSGHSHKALTDLKAVWQGAFTSIGAGSVSYCSSLGNDPGRDFINSASAPEGHKWKISNGDCHSAYVIDVHDGFLAVKPFEIKYLRPLAEEMVVPIPARPDSDYAFAKRKAKKPPMYAKQPKVEIREVTCRNWKGKPYPMQQLSFAAVPQGDRAHSRVYGYRVTMRPKDGTKEIVHVVRAAGSNMPIEMEPATVCWNVKPGTFGKAEDYDFEIVPMDCFRTPAK